MFDRRRVLQTLAGLFLSAFGTGAYAMGWEPSQQRPELWRLYNTRLGKDQTARVFPLSNWTETDIWDYALLHKIHMLG